MMSHHSSSDDVRLNKKQYRLNLGGGGYGSGRGRIMGRFRPSYVRLVYFLRKSTEFHVNRTECQIILIHILLLIFS